MFLHLSEAQRCLKVSTWVVNVRVCDPEVSSNCVFAVAHHPLSACTVRQALDLCGACVSVVSYGVCYARCVSCDGLAWCNFVLIGIAHPLRIRPNMVDSCPTVDTGISFVWTGGLLLPCERYSQQRRCPDPVAVHSLQ